MLLVHCTYIHVENHGKSSRDIVVHVHRVYNCHVSPSSVQVPPEA